MTREVYLNIKECTIDDVHNEHVKIYIDDFCLDVNGKVSEFMDAFWITEKAKMGDDLLSIYLKSYHLVETSHNDYPMIFFKGNDETRKYMEEK